METEKLGELILALQTFAEYMDSVAAVAQLTAEEKKKEADKRKRLKYREESYYTSVEEINRSEYEASTQKTKQNSRTPTPDVLVLDTSIIEVVDENTPAVEPPGVDAPTGGLLDVNDSTEDVVDVSPQVFTEDKEYELDPEAFIADKFSKEGWDVGIQFMKSKGLPLPEGHVETRNQKPNGNGRRRMGPPVPSVSASSSSSAGDPLNDEALQLVRQLTDEAAKQRNEQNVALANTMAATFAASLAQFPAFSSAPAQAPSIAPAANEAACPESQMINDLEVLDVLLSDGIVNDEELDLATGLVTGSPGAPSLVANLKRLGGLFKSGRLKDGAFMAAKKRLLGAAT